MWKRAAAGLQEHEQGQGNPRGKEGEYVLVEGWGHLSAPTPFPWLFTLGLPSAYLQANGAFLLTHQTPRPSRFAFRPIAAA